MTDAPLQPNCRCTFCNKVFYITPEFDGFIECKDCGSKFKDSEIRIK